MNFKSFLVIVLFSWACHLPKSYAQHLTSVYVESGSAITALPFAGAPQLLYTNYHPCLTFGARWVWKEKRSHAWEQTLNAGYIYHRFVQHSIPLFTESVYRLTVSEKFWLRAHLGLGYLHSIPGTDRFMLNDAGEYEKINALGRAQGMGKISFSGSYKINEAFSASLNYGVLLQGPFVKSYVPLLPYNTLQVGVHKSIN